MRICTRAHGAMRVAGFGFAGANTAPSPGAGSRGKQHSYRPPLALPHPLCGAQLWSVRPAAEVLQVGSVSLKYDSLALCGTCRPCGVAHFPFFPSSAIAAAGGCRALPSCRSCRALPVWSLLPSRLLACLAAPAAAAVLPPSLFDRPLGLGSTAAMKTACAVWRWQP